VKPRRRLLRWANWFAVVNVAVLAIVGAPYLWHYAALGRSVSWSYAIVAYVGHLGALACLPLLVLLSPAVALIPRARFVLPLGVVCAGAVVAFVVLDSLLFSANRYHLGRLTFMLLEPTTWAFGAFYFLVALAVEAMLALWVWQRTASPGSRRIGRYVALGLVGCFVATHVVHAWAAAHYDVSIMAFNRYLPLFYPLRNPGLLARLGLMDRATARERSVAAALQAPPSAELIYPLAPLRCDPRAPAYNILVVVIDAMRADALTPDVAPRLEQFARRAIRFDHHYSGGNTSRTGLFSLFYGVPGTYFDAFANRARPPVLMDELRRSGYELGVFTSAPLYRLVDLDRTAFARIPDLRRETSAGIGSSAKDRALTDEWLQWLDRRDPSRPFFGFLYYDAAVALDPPADYHPPIRATDNASAEMRQRQVRYATAVHYDDSLVGRVLDDLERRALTDRTVIIVTSDHGIEFDESGLGFKGHGTSYSDYQIRTPLVVSWPRHAPGRIDRRTSHNDVAPTMLTELLGCANPPSDYSSGSSLFAGAPWDWLVVTSNREFAVVEPDRVTIVFAAGYEIRERDYRLARTQMPSRDATRAAMREVTRFYR